VAGKPQVWHKAMPQQPVATIGRGKQNDIVINDESPRGGGRPQCFCGEEAKDSEGNSMVIDLTSDHDQAGRI